MNVFYLSLLLFSISFVNADEPNIIVIVVDDLGYADMSWTELANDVSTPNIDRLAKEGMRFTDAYATAPICNASRIAIMTGIYQQKLGTRWYSGPGLSRCKYKTIAESLKSNGYTCGYVGKFHHGTGDNPKGRGYPLNHGFDKFYGFSGGTKHYLHHSSNYKDRNLHEGPMYVQREKRNVEGFTTELFGENARNFIRENKDNKFYLHLSFNAVHNFTHQLPESYLKLKELKGFKDLDQKKDYWKWRQKIGYPAHPEGRDYYLGQLYFLDREIGLLLKQLESSGLREETALFFISDNGGSSVTYANNLPLKGGKYTLFEGGIRIPFIAAYPGTFKAGSSSNLVSTLDLHSTLCALSGVKQPPETDGLNLLPLLKGGDMTVEHKSLFWDTGKQLAVRSGKWKYLTTKSIPHQKLQIVDTPKGEFLYDLSSDPGESKNLLKIQPETAVLLKKLLHQWQNQVRNSAAEQAGAVLE